MSPSLLVLPRCPRILLRIIISEIFIDADMRTVDGNVRHRAGSVDQWRHDH